MGERCIRLPYADSITNDCQKVGWNCGIYGWNWTVYMVVVGFNGVIISGYRSFPAWAITPTRTELKELHRAYKQGPKALIKALENVQGALMKINEKMEDLKEIEVTLNVRILLANKDLDRDTYQEMFDLLKELNSN